MHLKKITIQNFRCFEHLELELHPRLNVLVAENGGGKTAILDAIAIGLSPILEKLSTATQRLEGVKFTDTDFTLVPYSYDGEQRWQAAKNVKIDIETTEDIHWDISQSSTSKGNKNNKALSDYTEQLLENVTHSQTPTQSALVPVFAYYGTRRGNNEIPKRIHETKRDYTFRLSALANALSASGEFDELLKWFDREERKELVKKQDEPTFVSRQLDLVRKTLSALLDDAYTNPHFNEDHKFSIKRKDKRGELQISQLSQGYQSILSLGMDFARRLAIANEHLNSVGTDFDWPPLKKIVEQYHPDGLPGHPPLGPAWAPAVMLIDEIDLHLHPSWQQRVLGDLMRAFPNTQFIVTTHSPQVLTTVKNENIRIIKQNSEGTWEALPPTTPEVKGVESSVALNDIMGVNATPETEETKLYAEYIAEIENGAGTPGEITARKKQLKEQLLSIYKEDHPLMLYAERLERFQNFKLRNKQPSISSTHAQDR
jgi:predicted ATP-binding protein involved in virulence